MVFVNESWNNTGDIIVYSNYHKYWLDRDLQIKNPLFDVFSGKILDLKNGSDAAIDYFYNLIDSEICKGVTICVVPSSNSEKTITGMTRLGEKLASNGRFNKVDYLLRKQTIDKLASGGDRRIYVHYESIEPNPELRITGDVILLMDDVTTTGNSLYACKDILLAYGAEHVEMFALGKAI